MTIDEFETLLIVTVLQFALSPTLYRVRQVAVQPALSSKNMEQFFAPGVLRAIVVVDAFLTQSRPD